MTGCKQDITKTVGDVLHVLCCHLWLCKQGNSSLYIQVNPSKLFVLATQPSKLTENLKII